MVSTVRLVILALILIPLFYICTITLFASTNNSLSFYLSAFGVSENKKKFVQMLDNSSGHLSGWNPDGKKVQFKIIDTSVKNNSVVSSSINNVPHSGLYIGISGTGNLDMAGISNGGKLLVLYSSDFHHSSIFELDPASNILSPTNISINNMTLNTKATNVDSYNIYLCCQLDRGTQKILVINLPTLSITGKIDVGAGARKMFGTFSGSHNIYLTDWSSEGVKVINTKTNTLTSTIRTGLRPISVSFGYPDKIYVLNSFYESGTNGTVSVINAGSNQVIRNIEVGNTPSDMVVDDLHHTLYVTNSGSPSGSKPNGTVSVINTISNKIIDTIAVGRGASNTLLNQKTDTIYVANWDSNTISVINARSNKVVGTIAVQESPYDISLSSYTNTIYVQGPNSISVINATSNKVIDIIPMKLASNMIVDSISNMVYVKHRDESQGYDEVLSIIDGSTNSLVPTNLVTCDVSSIVGSKYFWLKCTGPPSENAVLNYSLETP
jgi:YVTN family beta-propeller protein